MLKVVESKSNIELLLEWIVLSLSVIFIISGFGGLIMIVTAHGYSDELLNYAYTFVYSYMFILGIFLMIFRKKILVKK